MTGRDNDFIVGMSKFVRGCSQRMRSQNRLFRVVLNRTDRINKRLCPPTIIRFYKFVPFPIGMPKFVCNYLRVFWIMFTFAGCSFGKRANGSHQFHMQSTGIPTILWVRSCISFWNFGVCRPYVSYELYPTTNNSKLSVMRLWGWQRSILLFK